jgi:hypothetical protein
MGDIIGAVIWEAYSERFVAFILARETAAAYRFFFARAPTRSSAFSSHL